MSVCVWGAILRRPQVSGGMPWEADLGFNLRVCPEVPVMENGWGLIKKKKKVLPFLKRGRGGGRIRR